METWLGTGIDHAYIDRGDAGAEEPWPTATLVAESGPLDLPESVSCHTSLYFVPPGSTNGQSYSWQTIYARDDKPVVIERSIGKGTIVLSALSYFVSNEAMRNERHPRLLLWLAGRKRHVIFDELHHGIMQQRGVATLARQYRLHWFGAGLLVLAALFVWKNSASLVPADSSILDTAAQPVAEGKDSAAGLTNLLRRNIKRNRILKTCVDEYKTSIGRVDKTTRENLKLIEERLEEEAQRPLNQRNSARAYNEMWKVLSEK